MAKSELLSYEKKEETSSKERFCLHSIPVQNKSLLQIGCKRLKIFRTTSKLLPGFLVKSETVILKN